MSVLGDDPPPPPYTPSTGARTPIRQATVAIDCEAALGRVERLWAGIGYDEINWTYTPTGKRLLRTVAGFAEQPYYVRTHYVLCSGTGISLRHWGAGNVYHEDPNGRPHYDFTIADRVYDAIVDAGHRPLVELAYTPLALVPEAAWGAFPFQPSPTQYGAYEAGLWSYPPSDYGRWADLVAALVGHCVERYGEREVAGWPWELWNEPNIFYWRGTAEQYHQLYGVTARAVRAVLPGALVGGPATTGDASGPPFLRAFLRYCREDGAPLDFVSFHTKGAAFRPIRTYAPPGAPPPERQSPSLLKMLRELRASLAVVSEFQEFADLPCLVDECDASVPAHRSAYDNPNFAYRNTEYYPVFQCKQMKKLLDLNAGQRAAVSLAMTWSFYFEGEAYFEGTRSLLTAGEIEKPLLNAYRMLARLRDTRVAARSSHAWGLERLDDGQAGMPEEVDALASVGDGSKVAALVWRHADDQYHTDAEPAEVRVTVANLPATARRALVREWRIDRAHSNSHTVWRELGAPADPSPAQLARIRARQGLEPLTATAVDVRDRSVTLRLDLPLPGVSLVELEPRDR